MVPAIAGPVDQARIFRDALLDRGWTAGEDGDFKHVELGDEGRASTDIDQKGRVFEHFADLLDRRLRTVPDGDAP